MQHIIFEKEHYGLSNLLKQQQQNHIKENFIFHWAMFIEETIISLFLTFYSVNSSST